MPEVLGYGWDDVNKEWVKLQVNVDGSLKVNNPDPIFDEIRLVPKASSTGAEGTVYYDSDDDHLYVATE